MRGASIACALALCGCVVYRPRATEAIPAAPQPAAQIYVPVPDQYPTLGEPNLRNWGIAASEASVLQRAGLAPFVVTRASQIPADAPFVRHLESRSLGQGDDCGGFTGQRVLTVLTVGLWPTHTCERFVYTLELHRTSAAPAEKLEAVYQVDYIIGWLAAPIGLPNGYAFDPGDGPTQSGLPALRGVVLDALERPPTGAAP